MRSRYAPTQSIDAVGRRDARALHERALADRRLLGAPGVGEHGVEVAVERVERELPGVALVGDELEQRADRARLVGADRVLEHARERAATPLKPVLGEELADLELEVRALLDHAEQLEHELVAVDDRRCCSARRSPGERTSGVSAATAPQRGRARCRSSWPCVPVAPMPWAIARSSAVLNTSAHSAS